MQKVYILMRSHLFILSFMSLTLGEVSVRMFLHGMSEIFLPMFSSRTFMLLRLIFKSFIHLEFIFVYGVSWWLSFIFLHIAVQISQYHLLKQWVDPKTMVYLHNGILCRGEKEGASTLCTSMDGTGEHYAKWNKPGGEGQIPYDLTFKWNIINRKKKETKYNQRHWS